VGGPSSPRLRAPEGQRLDDLPIPSERRAMLKHLKGRASILVHGDDLAVDENPNIGNNLGQLLRLLESQW